MQMFVYEKKEKIFHKFKTDLIKYTGCYDSMISSI